MKAVIQHRYGPPDEVLSVEQIDRPVPGEGEVLVKVMAASVHADVWHVVTGLPLAMRLFGSGLRVPKYRVPGTDLAGVVEAVGPGARRFNVGDEVFGESHGSMQWRNGGAFAEYAAVPEQALALKPGQVSFEQAATIPTSGLIALHNLKSAGPIKAGQSVLINGAAGGVGAIAVQLAKAYGARVTGVDAGDRLDLVHALGADQVVDYRQRDITRGDERFDLILDVASTLSFNDCKRILTANGVYVLIGHDHYGRSGRRVLGSLPHFFKLTAMSPFVKQLPRLNFDMPSKEIGMKELKGWLEAGKLTPLVDSTYPLEGVVEAIRRLQDGQARGRLIITPWVQSPST